MKGINFFLLHRFSIKCIQYPKAETCVESFSLVQVTVMQDPWAFPGQEFPTSFLSQPEHSRGHAVY